LDPEIIQPLYFASHSASLSTDPQTALSAVRNLKEVAVNGRNLRVEPSTDEPGPRRGGGGGGNRGERDRGRGGRGDDGPNRGPPSGSYGGGGGGFEPPYGGGGGGAMGGGGGGYQDQPPSGSPFGGPPVQRVDLNLLPHGQESLGGKATDAISKTLAAVSPGQMQDVMSGMKVSLQPYSSFVLITMFVHNPKGCRPQCFL